MHAAIVKAAQVPATDAKINAANLHVGHLLRLDDGIANILARERRINDLAFAHAARAALADADDTERAGVVDFANDGADFRRTHFQTDNDRGLIKHVYSCWVRLSWVWAPRAAPERLRARALGRCWSPTGRASQWPCPYFCRDHTPAASDAVGPPGGPAQK